MMKKIRKRTSEELEIINSFLQDYNISKSPDLYTIRKELFEECLEFQ